MSATPYQIRELQRSERSFNDRYHLGQVIHITSVYDAHTAEESKWMQWLLGMPPSQIGHWKIDEVIKFLYHPSIYYTGRTAQYNAHRDRLALIRGAAAAHAIDLEGVKFIADFEGYEPNWYDDGTGVQTIGYGHTSESLHGLHAPLNRGQALQLLNWDLDGYEADVNRLIKTPLTQPRFNVLTSFDFNLGPGNLAEIAPLVNRKDWQGAGRAMLQYVHGGGQVMPGLVRRREAESAILIRG